VRKHGERRSFYSKLAKFFNMWSISKSRPEPPSADWETFWGNKAAIFWFPFSGRCHTQRSVTLLFLFFFSLSLSLSFSLSTGRIETTRGLRRIKSGAYDLGCEQFRRSKVANGGSDCSNLPFPRGQRTPTQINPISLKRLFLEVCCPGIS